MIPPTSIDGTDITGATIDGQDVQEITVDGDTVFTAADFYGFEDGTFQGWTAQVDENDGNQSFSVGSDIDTPTGSNSLNFFDNGNGDLAVVMESPESYDSYNITFKAYSETNGDNQSFGMSIFDTVPDGTNYHGDNFTGWIYEHYADNMKIKDGGDLKNISAPGGNEEFLFEFSLNTSSNYSLIMKDSSNSTVVSDSGSYSTASSVHNPNLILNFGNTNNGKICVDDILIE